MAKIKVQNTEVTVITYNDKDYISLTDMVRNMENGPALIEKWLRNKNTVEFLGIWEEMYNPDFNSPEFEGIKNEAGLNRFILSVKQWVEKTNSKGIIAKAGRYGGTYAHKDIAFEFATWVSPQFKLYLLKEFQRECAWETETYDGRELETSDYIFRRHGERLPMTPSTFTWRFKLILKKHGLPAALNVHSLRHTNASLLIAGGADVATVAGLLGHSQPSTTLDIYTHAFDKNKKAASQVLQEGLEI